MSTGEQACHGRHGRHHPDARPAPRQDPRRGCAGGARPVHPSCTEIPESPGEIPSHACQGLYEGPGQAPGCLPQHGCICYLTGASTKPYKRLQEVLIQETEEQWKSQVRAQARQRAVTSGGLVITCRATFGFTANGTSDDGRVRDIITAVSPSHAARILEARERRATDDELQPLLAEAITESYFREGGTIRAGLRADFQDVEHLTIDF
ncbi:telomere-protecting terminal protein Tpg [Streptomyces sp. NPDC004752]